MLFALIGLATAQTAADARFALALFCNPTCDGTVMDALESDLSSIRGRSGFGDQMSKPGRIMGEADASFGIPDDDFLAAYGVGVDRPEQLKGSQQVLIAWFAGPTAEARTTLATAHAAFARAAEAGGGWVEDLDTQQIYGVEAWKKRDPAGSMDEWFVVDAAPQDEKDPDGSLRLVTRGLRRFGLPELMVDNVNPGLAGDVATVLNAVAHGLKDRPPSDEKLELKGETVEGSATFELATRLDDDPDDPIWRVSFDGQITVPGDPGVESSPEEAVLPPESPPLAIPAEASNAAVSPEAPSVPASPATPSPVPPSPVPPSPATPSPVSPSPVPPSPVSDLDSAHRMAITRLDTVVRDAWASGLPEGDVVAVSVPFKTRDGGNEFMWVELRTWEGTSMSGVLVNQPYNVENLRKGDMVNVSFQQVFDYIWKHADGTREGNATSRFVER